MTKQELRQKIQEIKDKKYLDFIHMEDKNHIDGAVLFEELNDANYLLAEDLSDKAINEVGIATTSGSIYDALEEYRKNKEV